MKDRQLYTAFVGKANVFLMPEGYLEPGEISELLAKGKKLSEDDELTDAERVAVTTRITQVEAKAASLAQKRNSDAA